MSHKANIQFLTIFSCFAFISGRTYFGLLLKAHFYLFIVVLYFYGASLPRTEMFVSLCGNKRLLLDITARPGTPNGHFTPSSLTRLKLHFVTVSCYWLHSCGQTFITISINIMLLWSFELFLLNCSFFSVDDFTTSMIYKSWNCCKSLNLLWILSNPHKDRIIHASLT